MQVWQAKSEVLPVTYHVSQPSGPTAAVCSQWNHYVQYPIEEIDRGKEGIAGAFPRALVALGSVLLRASHIDNVVWVNNWLLPTNPALDLSEDELRGMTAALCRAFPD